MHSNGPCAEPCGTPKGVVGAVTLYNQSLPSESDLALL